MTHVDGHCVTCRYKGMERGGSSALSRFALYLEQQYHHEQTTRRAREQENIPTYRQLSPSIQLAVKIAARRVLSALDASGQPTDGARVILSIVEGMAKQQQLQANSVLLDRNTLDLHLDQCDSWEHAAELALHVLITDSQNMSAAMQALHQQQRDAQWTLEAERQKTQQANNKYIDAQRTIRDLETKLKQAQEENKTLSHALGKTQHALDDANQHVAHMRKHIRDVAVDHTHGVCARIGESIRKERTYMNSEVRGAWGNAFKIQESALRGLEELIRVAFTRLITVCDASYDLASIPPLNGTLHHVSPSIQQQQHQQHNARQEMRASEPPLRRRRINGSDEHTPSSPKAPEASLTSIQLNQASASVPNSPVYNPPDIPGSIPLADQYGFGYGSNVK